MTPASMRILAVATIAMLAGSGCSSTASRATREVAAAAAASLAPMPQPDGVDAVPKDGEGANAAPIGMSGTQAAALNLSLAGAEEDAMRLVQSAAPDDDTAAAADESVSPDAALARLVRVLLRADPAYRNARVTVAVNAATVTLDGVMVSTAQRDALRRDVRLMPGVAGVDGTLDVRDN